jgi:hypothetical protein
VGFGAATLVAPQPGKARGGAQLPQLGFLLLGDAEGFATQLLGGFGMALPQQQPPLRRTSSAANQRSPVRSTSCNA